MEVLVYNHNSIYGPLVQMPFYLWLYAEMEMETNGFLCIQ